MSDKNIIKTIDEMPRFADSREKLEWAEAMYRKLCAEEGEMEVDLAETENVVITKYGKPAAKIVRIDKKDRCAKEIPVHIGSVAQLFGTLPGNADWKVIKQERLTK